VCDKTCIFCFFPIINKYLCMAKRSLLSERPSYIQRITQQFTLIKNGILLRLRCMWKKRR